MKKGIDPQTFQWPSDSEEEISNYWIIIRRFCDEYDGLIKYDDMQILMYQIGISIVHWTNDHKDIQEDIFWLPATAWAAYLPENIDFTK